MIRSLVPGSRSLPAAVIAVIVIAGGRIGPASNDPPACPPSPCPAAPCCSASACDPPGDPPHIGVDPAANRDSATMPARFRELDERLEAIRARHRTPALVAAVWKGGEIAAAGAAGVRVAGFPAPVEVGDRFHFGSCGKAMTATLAAILVQRGLIAWTTTVEDVFPDMAGDLRAGYRAVTLHQLLSHRGGLPHGRPVELADLEGPLPDQRRTLVSIIGRLEPVAAPGEAFLYSDLGYVVAGAMLEQVAGSSWERLVVEHVATPLGMDTLGFGAPGAESGSEPWGHIRSSEVLEGVPPGVGADGAAPALGPAGTIHASIADWGAFLALHVDGRGPAGTRLLDPATLEMLHADPYDQDYALGWALQRIGPRVDLAHSGSCGRWVALVRVIPERETAVAVASNYGGRAASAAVSEALDDLVLEYADERTPIR